MTNAPTRRALGIGLEEFEYPYPVGFLPVANWPTWPSSPL